MTPNPDMAEIIRRAARYARENGPTIRAHHAANRDDYFRNSHGKVLTASATRGKVTT